MFGPASLCIVRASGTLRKGFLMEDGASVVFLPRNIKPETYINAVRGDDEVIFLFRRILQPCLRLDGL